MRRLYRFLGACCLPVLLLPAYRVTTKEPPADLVLTNGKVFTSDPTRLRAEALAIRGERIIAVGTNAEVSALAGKNTRRIDLGGRVVVPGFNDAHTHFMPDPSGYTLRFDSQQPGQPPEPTWAEALKAVEAAAKQTPPGTWIFGQVGSNVVLNPEADRFALDRVAPEHPVLLHAYYGHGYVINSRAMPPLHITEEEADSAGGWYERVAGTRKINGRLWEYAAWKASRVLSDKVTDEEAIRLLRETAGEAVRYGITSVQIMPTMAVDRFARLLVKADLPIRVRAMPFSLTTAKGRDLSEIRGLARLKFPNSKVTASGIKWVLDGTPFERGAALRKDYNDRPGWRGRLYFPEADIAAMVKESLDLDQQILFHCAGDRAAEAVLDALDSFGNRVDWKRKRVRVEHGDGLTGGLIKRARDLGTVVVLNPTHFVPPQMIFSRYGPQTEFLQFRSLINAGVPVAIGSDGPTNPFLNIMFAIIHPARPTEAITREQAVEAYTRGSAYAEFKEGEKGAITSGKLADLTVLSQDIFTARPEELPATQSLLTIIGGRVVYSAGAFK